MKRPSEFDEQRRALLSASAEAYRDGRPGYPSEVFEHLAQACGLGPGCRVLEIGPGAGQATGPILDAGADVIAVEVGEKLGQLLLAKYGDRQLELILGDFDTVELPIEPVDLVVAATSFHWVPPDSGLARVADVLRPGGSVALWWNHYGDPDRPDPFREAVQPILRKHAPQLADNAGDGGTGIGAHPYALDANTRIAEIGTTGLFGPVHHELIAWTATHTPEQLRLFFASFSNWMALQDSVRNDLLDDVERLAIEMFSGAVQRPYLTAIYTAERC